MTSPWMSVLIAFLTALPPTITALIAVLKSKENGRQIMAMHQTLKSKQ